MADCIYTIVKNTSGKEQSFGYLPPHGRRLGVDEQMSVAGNLVDRIATGGRQQNGGKRYFEALERDLDNGDIQIVATPALVLYDAVADNAKALHLANGTLGIADPCWGAETAIST